MWGIQFNFLEIISAFMVLFAVIDITGSIPIILGLKANGNKIESGKAAIISTIIFVLFLFGGQAILGLFGVDISSFAVAGAIVIFILALEMLLGIQFFKSDANGSSATIVPIIFPLIAGAGSLTTLISIKAEYGIANIIVALLLNMIIVYIVLRYVDKVGKILGNSGIVILKKFFGIILLAISVKLFVTNIVTLF